jgi:hypothetical protein
VLVANGCDWFVNVKPATGRQFWATMADIPAMFGYGFRVPSAEGDHATAKAHIQAETTTRVKRGQTALAKPVGSDCWAQGKIRSLSAVETLRGRHGGRLGVLMR